MLTQAVKVVSLLLLLTKGSLAACQEGCVSCTDSSHCKKCDSSHYLHNSFCYHCHDTCVTCDGYRCTSCKAGWYGKHCRGHCVRNCKECQIDNGSCISCKSGYYGSNCDKECKRCKFGLCNFNSCTYGCNPGYYEIKMQGSKDCYPCSRYCQHCVTGHNCTVCSDGFYLQEYLPGTIICQSCSSRKFSCQTNCDIENCRICEVRDDYKFCTGCQENYIYNGGKCVLNTAECLTKCTTKCNTHGMCLGHCKDGLTGDRCAEQCPSKCSKCNKNESSICQNCSDHNSYTNTCDVECPSSCRRIAGSSTCRIDDGYCVNGCYENSWGITCNKYCSDGCALGRQNSNICDRIDGRCNNGCKPGFLGYNCNRSVTAVSVNSKDFVQKETFTGTIFTKESLDTSTPDKRMSVVLIRTLAGGLALITATYAFIACFIKIRRKLIRTENAPTPEEGDNFAAEGVNNLTSTASLLRRRTAVSNLLEYIRNKTDFKKEFDSLPGGLTMAYTEAIKGNKRVKNRYNGIYAYDATRVVLKSGNYVNANFIKGHKKLPAYIASIGPTRSTMNNFETFWEMVWQENINKIVMLTQLEEAKKMKCEQYWPDQGNENEYSDCKVKCKMERVFSEFIVREFLVSRGEDTREVAQYQYTVWPDKSVPDSVASLLEFRDKVEQKQLTTAGPMMVHCSNGIGRTGTYIALDILIKEGNNEHSVDIFACLNALRGQRVRMVQNLEQYVYLHHCVLYALSCAPEPLLVSTMTNFASDERLSTQHQAFISFKQMPNTRKIIGTNNTSTKENRTGAELADNKHRVRFSSTENDYTNAVHLNGYQEQNKYILAQTPLPCTLEDFVSMLYQERCPCMICLDDENLIDQSTAQFLPSLNKVATFGQFQVICKKVDRKQDFVSRELKVSRIGMPISEEMSVFHFQFRGWSNADNVPGSIQSFLNMVTNVENTYQRLNCKQPIVVHCSSGAKRSGLFCAVSILLEKVAVEKKISVINTVYKVCSRRMLAFEDIEHLRFCYYCVEQMSHISASRAYSNPIYV